MNMWTAGMRRSITTEIRKEDYVSGWNLEKMKSVISGIEDDDRRKIFEGLLWLIERHWDEWIDMYHAMCSSALFKTITMYEKAVLKKVGVKKISMSLVHRLDLVLNNAIRLTEREEIVSGVNEEDLEVLARIRNDKR